VLVDDDHEPGVAALVRALWSSLGVGGGEEQHVHPLDEGPILGGDRVVDLDVLEPVGEPPRVEAVLEPACAAVVELGHAVEYLRTRR
jgi:hypothetical protein